MVIYSGSPSHRDWASGKARAFLDQASELVGTEGIREVSLSHTDDLLVELTENRFFRALERITLLGPLDDEDVALIGRTPFSRLHTLVLEDSEMTGKGVRALLACGLAGQLIRLDLSGNPLGDEGFAALGGASFPTLEGLRVYGCQIGEDGAAAFARSATMPKLRELDLGGPYVTVHGGGGNALRSAGVEAMAGASLLGQLEVLLLSGNDVANEGAIALARVSMPIRRLDLTWNTIGAQGAAALAKAPWPQLEWLLISEGNPLALGAEADVYQFAELPREMTSQEVRDRYGFSRHVKDIL